MDLAYVPDNDNLVFKALQYVTDMFWNIPLYYIVRRISTQGRNGTILYQEHCPLSETAAESTSLVHSDIAITPTCLLYDYRDIVRSNSPGYSIFTSCYENEGPILTQRETATIHQIAVTAPTPPLENAILYKNFKNKSTYVLAITLRRDTVSDDA